MNPTAVKQRTKKHQPSAPIVGHGAPRVSARAAEANASFRELRSFFSSDSQLASAIGWSNDTVGDWQSRIVPTPRADKLDDISLFLEACLATAPYMRSNKAAGTWIATELPELKGASPAELLRTKRDVGLEFISDWLLKSQPAAESGYDGSIDFASISADLDA